MADNNTDTIAERDGFIVTKGKTKNNYNVIQIVLLAA